MKLNPCIQATANKYRLVTIMLYLYDCRICRASEKGAYMSLLADIYSVLSTAAPSGLQKCLQDIEVRYTNEINVTGNTNIKLRCICNAVIAD